ncbi:MAG: hypothetical protein HND57_02890 [Planctomycetes bacterium]|nr:hypothetical protein [Planctomycetota bacterium]
MPESPATLRRVITILAMICVIASITIRITGPSDIHDQTQPKTLSYTTDILTHSTDLDHWILPSIQQREPATKPPLYNWLAVPFVAVFGHQSIVAHKAPSLLTWLALIVILYRLGHHIDPAFRLTGPLAVIAFVTNYAWFKLGYLARPDGLLTLWLVIGWAAATALSDPSRTRPRFPAADHVGSHRAGSAHQGTAGSPHSGLCRAPALHHQPRFKRA